MGRSPDSPSCWDLVAAPSPLNPALLAASLWSQLGSSLLGSHSKSGQDTALPGTPTSLWLSVMLGGVTPPTVTGCRGPEHGRPASLPSRRGPGLPST